MEDLDKTKIPKGYYCYDKNGICPYWEKRDDKPEMESGYCRFLGVGDWEQKHLSLLWDQVKECGENNDDDP